MDFLKKKKNKAKQKPSVGMKNPFATSSYAVAYSYDNKDFTAEKKWFLGCRENQKIISIKLEGKDGMLKGKVAFADDDGGNPEGKIDCTLTKVPDSNNTYKFVDKWNQQGLQNWILGDREEQEVIKIDMENKYPQKSNTLKGIVCYAGEGPIDVKCEG